MAKSKSLSKREETAVEAPLTATASSGTPYQLEPAQVERATKALVAHMKQHAVEKDEKAAVKNLADDEDDVQENDQPIFLTITTKKHISDSQSLKPNKIVLPHPIIANDVRICIFTKDPQRAYKDVVASDAFPATLRAKVQRVLGVEKLKKRYKSFEQKRALLAEYDIFMLDKRVLKVVAQFLGKTFYKSKAKRPIPIDLTAGTWVDKAARGGSKEPQDVVGTPQGVAKEIETALNSTYLSLSNSANTSIKIGTLSQTPQQLVENTAAVVSVITSKHIPKGWRNVRALYIKGPATKALPIWLNEDIKTDERPQARLSNTDGGAQGKSAEKKRKWEEWEEELLDDDVFAEKQVRREEKKVKKAEKEKKKAISKEKRKALKEEVMQSVQTPLIA